MSKSAKEHWSYLQALAWIVSRSADAVAFMGGVEADEADLCAWNDELLEMARQEYGGLSRIDTADKDSHRIESGKARSPSPAIIAAFLRSHHHKYFPRLPSEDEDFEAIRERFGEGAVSVEQLRAALSPARKGVSEAVATTLQDAKMSVVEHLCNGALVATGHRRRLGSSEISAGDWSRWPPTHKKTKGQPPDTKLGPWRSIRVDAKAIRRLWPLGESGSSPFPPPSDAAVKRWYKEYRASIHNAPTSRPEDVAEARARFEPEGKLVRRSTIDNLRKEYPKRPPGRPLKIQ